MRRMVHRLREARSLRAFAFEVTIVVVGVLIALGAQQLAEAWNWRQKVAAGEQRLKDDAKENSYALVEQLMVGPCVDAQFDLLDAKLRAPGPWAGTATYPSSHAREVIRAPSRTIPTDLWATLGAEGTALHFDARRAVKTAFHYEQLHKFGAEIDKSRERRAALDFLARPTDLSTDTRARLLEAIATLRRSNSLQSLMAVQLLATLHDLGRLSPLAALEAEMDEISDSPTSTLSVCAARGLPIGDWKAVLRQQIEKNRIYDERMRQIAR